jgi:hypothetical protein
LAFDPDIRLRLYIAFYARALHKTIERVGRARQWRRAFSGIFGFIASKHIIIFYLLEKNSFFHLTNGLRCDVVC